MSQSRGFRNGSIDDSMEGVNSDTAAETREELLRRGLQWAYVATVWAVVEAALAFVVGSRADSAMLLALAHLATVDILPCLVGWAQIAAMLKDEAVAFGDRQAEALAFGIGGLTSLVAAVSVGVRTDLHFHLAGWSVSHAQHAEAAALAGSSAIVWYVIARAKRGIAHVFQSRALYADADGVFYSACVVCGVLLTLVLLWFAPWAPLDSGASILIAGLLVWQGVCGIQTSLRIRRRVRHSGEGSSHVSSYAPR